MLLIHAFASSSAEHKNNHRAKHHLARWSKGKRIGDPAPFGGGRTVAPKSRRTRTRGCVYAARAEIETSSVACLLQQAGGGIRHFIVIESTLRVNENNDPDAKLMVIRTSVNAQSDPLCPYFARMPAAKRPVRPPKAASDDRLRRFSEALGRRYPDAHCALVHRNPFELLIATILSAQTTDVAVNKVTPALFREYPNAAAMARATPEALEPFLRSIGLFRNKSKNISGASKMLVDEFGGRVPRTMHELIRLPGVARKTANVVLGNSFGINEGFVVDTHIARLAVRFGIAAEGDDVATIERKLMAAFPRDKWCEISHQLIWHGRAVCKARGGTCENDPICSEFGVACPGRKGSVKSASRSSAARAAPMGRRRR